MEGWAQIRQRVLERDNFRCQQCYILKPKNELDVHHIFPYTSFKPNTKFNVINNLISLCRFCHRMVEPRHYSIVGAATTILVSKKLTDKLKELGSKGESYEDVIWRCVEAL